MQNRHTPKGSEVQWMVHRNQHIVVALHLAVSMNVWLLYDLNGVKPKRLLLQMVEWGIIRSFVVVVVVYYYKYSSFFCCILWHCSNSSGLGVYDCLGYQDSSFTENFCKGPRGMYFEASIERQCEARFFAGWTECNGMVCGYLSFKLSLNKT